MRYTAIMNNIFTIEDDCKTKTNMVPGDTGKRPKSLKGRNRGRPRRFHHLWVVSLFGILGVG